MRKEIKEARRLKELLAIARLSPSERQSLEDRIRELEKLRFGESHEAMSQGVLGVFDRPNPVPKATPSASESRAHESAPASKRATTDPPKHDPTEPELVPEEAEALAERIAEMAERIVWLRSIWARTLSIEIDRESEAWLAKLQGLAKKLPKDLVDSVLADRAYLVRQKVRDLRRDQISEEVQLQTLPPSAPSLDPIGTGSAFYFAIREARAAPIAQHPLGYVPDGLERFL